MSSQAPKTDAWSRGAAVVVSALCLSPRDVRATRGDGILPADPGEAGEAALSAPVPAAPR